MKSNVAKNTRRLIVSQFIIGAIVTLLYVLFSGTLQGLSAAYGSFTTMLISAYLSYGVIKAEKVAQTNPKKSLGILYFGAVQRFVMVIGMFIIGLAILKLEPLATTIGFGLAQLGYVVNLRQQAQVNG